VDFCLFIIPVCIYSNPDIQKKSIIKENKEKAGVYRWINVVNGNEYIGSSKDLGRRLQSYYNINSLKRNYSMRICLGSAQPYLSLVIPILI
jgi:hypothetical protein